MIRNLCTSISVHTPNFSHSKDLLGKNNKVLKIFSSSYFRLTSRPICVVVVSPFHHAMLLFFFPFSTSQAFMHEIASRRFQLLSNKKNRKTEGKICYFHVFEGRRLKNIDKNEGVEARYHWKWVITAWKLKG